MESRFTLIELLTVVVVIVALLSLLLPVLSASRALARQTLCASNQRQIGMAFETYASDNNNYCPAANTGNAGMECGYYTIYDWTHALWPYAVGAYEQHPCAPFADPFKKSVFFCSASPATLSGSLSPASISGTWYRYGMNWYSLSLPGGYGYSGDKLPLPASYAKSPAKNVLTGEVYMINTCHPYTFFTLGMGLVSHSSGTNFLFMDKHMEYRKYPGRIPAYSIDFWNGGN